MARHLLQQAESLLQILDVLASAPRPRDGDLQLRTFVVLALHLLVEVREFDLCFQVIECEPDERFVAQQLLELRERAALQEQVADLRIPVLRLVALAQHVVRSQLHAHRFEPLIHVDGHCEHARCGSLCRPRFAERDVFQRHEQQLVDCGAATDVDAIEEAQRELAVQLLQRLVHEVERLEIGLRGVERLLHQPQRARRFLWLAFRQQRSRLEEARAVEQLLVATFVATHATDRKFEARARCREVRCFVGENAAQEVRLGRCFAR